MVKFLDLQKVTAKYADEIHEAVLHAIDSGWYLQGEENKRFETAYARYRGTQYAIGCANGLDALIWIWRAYIEMGVMQAGDEVIVPANTYIATILALTENGLKPVLVEPSIETYEIDDSKIEKAITSKTKAICIVHLYGQCAYTEKIGALCEKYNLKLVEDNAQAHGCVFNGKKTGSIGDAAGHSFYKVAFLSKRIDIIVIVVPVGQADAISVGYAMPASNGAIHRKRRTTRGTIMSFVRAIR